MQAGGDDLGEAGNLEQIGQAQGHGDAVGCDVVKRDAPVQQSFFPGRNAMGRDDANTVTAGGPGVERWPVAGQRDCRLLGMRYPAGLVTQVLNWKAASSSNAAVKTRSAGISCRQRLRLS